MEVPIKFLFTTRTRCPFSTFFLDTWSAFFIILINSNKNSIIILVLFTRFLKLGCASQVWRDLLFLLLSTEQQNLWDNEIFKSRACGFFTHCIIITRSLSIGLINKMMLCPSKKKPLVFMNLLLEYRRAVCILWVGL